MCVQIRAMAADAPDAAALIAAMVTEVGALYGGRPAGGGLAATDPAELAPPHGVFLVLYDGGGRPLAGGGLRRLQDGVAEVKRMYVVPDARGRGLARKLLGALEDAARERGYRIVRLDSGWRQPHALALYASAGYRAIADYNGNPAATYWGEKALA